MKYLAIAFLLIACDYPEHYEGWDTGSDTGDDTDTHNSYDYNVSLVRDSTPCYLGRYSEEDVAEHTRNVARDMDSLEEVDTECVEVAAEFAYQLTEMGVCPLDDMGGVCVDYQIEFWEVNLPNGMEALYGDGCGQIIEDNYGCI